MCEQCTTNCLQYGEVVPGWFLIRAQQSGNIMQEGEWGLVEMNDPAFVFKTAPVPDPAYTMDVDSVDDVEWDEQVMAWLDSMEEIEEAFSFAHVRTGHRLVSGCKEAGYDEDENGDVVIWLIHRMGELVQNTTPKTYDELYEEQVVAEFGFASFAEIPFEKKVELIAQKVCDGFLAGEDVALVQQELSETANDAMAYPTLWLEAVRCANKVKGVV